jgi:phosphatidylinositol-3,4,5-trisphosphate 3-phosphatase/dual-specificity protein phosphatase PTEN
VSKKKKRFEEDGYNLDLTYITDNIVAMGFPSSGTEALYRNSMSDTIEFFKERHGMGHFKVYNLCSERSYDHEKFGSFVEVFPFDDHVMFFSLTNCLEPTATYAHETFL